MEACPRRDSVSDSPGELETVETDATPPQKVLRDAGTFGESHRRTRSSQALTDLKKCIICQDEKRQSKNRRLFKRLVRLECDSAPGTLCNAAQVRQLKTTVCYSK